jgi:hypothetical protein
VVAQVRVLGGAGGRPGRQRGRGAAAARGSGARARPGRAAARPSQQSRPAPAPPPHPPTPPPPVCRALRARRPRRGGVGRRAAHGLGLPHHLVGFGGVVFFGRAGGARDGCAQRAGAAAGSLRRQHALSGCTGSGILLTSHSHSPLPRPRPRFVNSASHVWGYQSYNTGDQSRNNWCGRGARGEGGAQPAGGGGSSGPAALADAAAPRRAGEAHSKGPR